MRHLLVAGAVMVLCIGVGRVEAQGVASTFDQLTVLVAPGDKITVAERSGQEIQGRVGMLSADKLTLVTESGPREFGEADVAQIRQRRSDSLQNGAVIGAAAGAGYAAAMVALLGTMSDGGEANPAGVVVALVTFTGLGAAAGAGIDAMIARTQVIYRRPGGGSQLTVSPLVGRGRRGVAATLTF